MSSGAALFGVKGAGLDSPSTTTILDAPFFVSKKISCASYFPFHTSGFSTLAGRCPLNKSVTFLAAITAIFVRVSSYPDAICGANTTFGRFNPG